MNWARGLTRIGVVAYPAWALGYLTWSGFWRDLTNWLGMDSIGGFKNAVGVKMKTDLEVALIWPLAAALAFWMVWVLAIPILKTVFGWIASGFRVDTE